jgi:formylmethanofuran dehydrogenase subunit C
METVTLTIKNQPDLYLEADNITPDAFAGKKAEAIADLHVYVGREQYRLGDFFEVSGNAGATPEETKVVVNGDLSRVKYIGMKMTGGEVVVNGNADMYVGAWMQGGKLTVNGNVDAFAGTGMKGGEIVVNGNAGNYLGAAYRGDWRGMASGKITVTGNAGSDLGTFMTGGEIVVGGDVDVHVATHAEGGKIVIKGNAKSRLGGQMVEGEIYVLGNIDVMMPGFAYREDVDVDMDGIKGRFALYEGDLGERHRKRKGQLIYAKLYQQIRA